jgi:hypothetical protein
MTTRRGDDDGIPVLGSWSQANSVLAQDAPLEFGRPFPGPDVFIDICDCDAVGLRFRAVLTAESGSVSPVRN